MTRNFDRLTVRLLCATCLSGLWSVGAVAQSMESEQAEVSSPAKPNSAAQKGGLEEIVVTASKRTENLQDTPSTVNVLGHSQIESLGIQNFSDFTALVPNLSETGASTPGLGTIVLRGLYAGNFTTSQATATYLGETPITANGALAASGFVQIDPDLLDVERIEVLKGPQGTLFGATSLGGIIRIIPQDPDPKSFSAQVRVDGSAIDSGGIGGGIRASANVPVTENSAIRVAAFAKNDPGFTTNVATGHHDLGNTNAEGLSAAGKLQINSDWDVKLSGLYENSLTRGYQFQTDAPGTGTPLVGQREYSYPIDGGSHSTYWLVEGQTNYTTDIGTITGVVSRVHTDTRILQDATDNFGALENLVYPKGTLPAGFNVTGLFSPTADKTDVELRFASNRIGNFEFLGGVFFADEDTKYPVTLQNQFAGSPLQLPVARLNYVADVTSNENYKEYAGFGNGTYYITDDLDITGGLRYAYNSQVVHQQTFHPGLISLVGDQEYSASSVVYQASARWRPSKEMSLYFRSASGYRPGGTQSAGPYAADTTVTYEGGVKGQLFGRFSYDIDAYHTDWNQIHLTGTNPSGVGVILNGGDATIDGAEVELNYKDPSGLVLGFNAGLSEATLNTVNPQATLALGAHAGDRLPGSPRVTAAGTVDYYRDLIDGVTGSVGATVKYQGDQVSSYPGAVKDKNYNIPSYTTLDLRTSLDWQKYTASFKINNVTDKNAVTGYYVYELGAGVQPANAYLIRPRTFLLSFTARL